MDRPRRLGIGLALQQTTFVDGRLVHRWLVHETGHAVDRAFAGPDPEPPTTPEPHEPDP